MTEIPSSAVSASENNLKEVVVDDGCGVSDEQERQRELEHKREVKEDSVKGTVEDDLNSISDSDKADGRSPKPSKVLKMWPKADPFPVRALYTFKTKSNNELAFRKGDTITVLDCRGRWWQAQKDDRIGFIPSNYVVVLLKARVISNFTAIEDDQVSVTKDQIIEVMERYDEKCLVRNVDDKIGAVPSNRLDFIIE